MSSYDFHFSSTCKDATAFKTWLAAKYPNATFESETDDSVSVTYFDGMYDSFEGDNFYKFLDAVEAAFPEIKYEAKFKETVDVVDSVISDISASYENGVRTERDSVLDYDPEDPFGLMSHPDIKEFVDRYPVSLKGWFVDDDYEIVYGSTVDEWKDGVIERLLWGVNTIETDVDILEEHIHEASFIDLLMLLCLCNETESLGRIDKKFVPKMRELVETYGLSEAASLLPSD